MPATKKTATKKTATKDDAPETSTKKGFRVVDSNGKTFRVVKSEDEATSLAESIGGRVK